MVDDLGDGTVQGDETRSVDAYPHTRIMPRYNGAGRERSGIGGTGRVQGHDRALPLGVGGPLATRARAAAGRAQRADRGARRRGVRAAGLLRLGHRHAHDRRPGRVRAALRQLPHHRPVQPDPGVRADGSQPPLLRHGPASSTWPRGSPATTPGSRARAACSRPC
jgi:hypothetical protein